MRKGISPLIATIMLIAFTMIVAGVLATWATRFAETQASEVDYCLSARIYIRSGSYDAGTETLRLVVDNYGKVPLSFNVLLGYQNGTVYTYGGGDLFNTTAGSITTFEMTGVTNNLKEATIRSTRCPGAQDLLNRRYISGLGSE